MNFVEFCTFNDLVIGGTLFPHKTIHKTAWTFPDGKNENQFKHITISRKWRRSFHDVRVKRGADAASDHHLIVAVLKTKLKVYKDQAAKPSHKYNVHTLKVKFETEKFMIELRNRFSFTREPSWRTLAQPLRGLDNNLQNSFGQKKKEWLLTDT